MSTLQRVRIWTLLGLLAVAWCSIGFAEEKGLSKYKIDFGIDSACFPGFTPVGKKIYSPEKVYGWKVDDVSLRYDNGVPDILCTDYVVLRQGEFIVDLPNGNYLITLWMGSLRPSVSPPLSSIPHSSYWVKAEGEKKIEVKCDSSNFFKEFYYRNVDNDYQGEDIWEKYIASKYGPHNFKVKVADGQLNLEFQAITPSAVLYSKLARFTYYVPDDALTINGLLIYPEEKGKEWKEELEGIEEKRRTAFYENFLPPEKKLTSEPDIKDEKNYILFSTHYMKRIYPDTIPLSEEIDKELSAFATPGEYEPVSFGVYPLEELKDVKVEVTDLSCKDQIIKKENINIRLVRYVAKPSDFGDFGLKPSPILIEPKYLYQIISPLNIKKGFTRSFQLTIKIPDESKPGIYQGEIIFKSKNAPSSSLPLKLRVLPFKLAVPSIPIVAQRSAWELECPYLLFPDLEEEYWRQVEMMYRDIKEHSLTSVQINMGDTVKWDLKQEKITFDPYYLERCLSLYKKVNLPSEEVEIEMFGAFFPPSYGNLYLVYEKEIISLLRQIKEKVEKKGLKPIFLLVGEATNYKAEGLKYTEELYRMLQEKAPDIKTGSVLTSLPWDARDIILAPYLNRIGLHTAPESYPLPELVKKIREKNSYFLYNAGHFRLSWGFYLWATGAIGRSQEFYQMATGDPYNFFDGRYPDDMIACVLPGPDGPIPLLSYEEIREGVDDYRYVLTLENLIKEAKNKGRIKESIVAENTLKKVRDQINPDLDYYTETNLPEGRFYDNFRWQIAAEIIKLEEGLR